MLFLNEPIAISWNRTLLVMFVVALSACTSLPKPESGDGDRQALVAEVLSGQAVLGRNFRSAELPDHDILHVTEEMQAFLDRYVGPHRARHARAAALLKSLLSDGMLGLDYSEDTTLTASGAFQALRANCLAFSNLYVAMARKAGLKAYYQDVLVAPQWEMTEGSMTLRRHVNVLVSGIGEFDQIIDISRSRRNVIRLNSKRLTDRQAFAQYYNNIAIERMYEENYEQAFLYVRKALLMDRRSAFIWSNLGVIVSRVGKVDHAEAVLQKAASIDSSEHAALINLATIYRSKGMIDLADHYDERVRSHRAKNPYYLMMNAGQAHATGKSDEALKLLNKALRLKDDEALIFEMLSKVHEELGQMSQAIEALTSALEVAETPRQKTEYDERLQALLEEERRRFNKRIMNDTRSAQY